MVPKITIYLVYHCKWNDHKVSLKNKAIFFEKRIATSPLIFPFHSNTSWKQGRRNGWGSWGLSLRMSWCSHCSELWSLDVLRCSSRNSYRLGLINIYELAPPLVGNVVTNPQLNATLGESWRYSCQNMYRIKSIGQSQPSVKLNQLFPSKFSHALYSAANRARLMMWSLHFRCLVFGRLDISLW